MLFTLLSIRDRIRPSGMAACLLAIFLLTTTAANGQKIGATLHEAVAVAGPLDQVEVVVTFHGDGPIGQLQRLALAATGATGIYFESLPIAGLLATPAQINAIANIAGVRSVWLNEELQWENDGSTALTGVDRLRTDPNMRTAMGLPFSGKGVGVLVNDSGVDGLHADIAYPDHVVQNVAAQTNLHALSSLLPVSYTEDVPNTDIGGGHGSHVAGIIGGTGAQSNGKYEGVAPGASIIGYGSGAGVFILDTIGGFDYALTHQTQYNIRVVSNSFGSTGDTGTDFDPDHPTNVATKALADRGVVVVFSAGNSGAGEASITGNFKKAPWVVSVAAGDKNGNLADFSSRGRRGVSGSVTIDGQSYTWVDRPTVTAPGVDVISVNASTGTFHGDTTIEPAFMPYYTTLSGTSMACPHVSGIVALMLEANPQLDWPEVKAILEQTATNMPALEAWQAGAGYVNAYAAVVRALELRTDFGRTLNLTRSFNSNVTMEYSGGQDFAIDFSPVGETGELTFNVGSGVDLVSARAVVDLNTVALVLIDPAGNRHGSAISLPQLGPTIGVSAPGMPGEWRLTVSGIGSVSGVPLDPLGVTNGTAVPETIEGVIRMLNVIDYSGLNDIDGHPAELQILSAVTKRLVDGDHRKRFRPDRKIERGELADYLVMGVGVRQYLPLDGSSTFGDVSDAIAPFVEAATARGAALKDREQKFAGLIQTSGNAFNPGGAVDRASLAYSFVQSLGLEPFASSFGGEVTVEYMGSALPVEDAADIPADLRGYVQYALALKIMHAHFQLEQGPFDLQPTVKAYFRPAQAETRAEYAVLAGRYADSYVYGFTMPGAGDGESAARMSRTDRAEISSSLDLALSADDSSIPKEVALDQNYPNPFNPTTQISFDLPDAGAVRLVVYDIAGREVRVLVDSELAEGRHAVSFDAGRLASGSYVYRLETPSKVITRQMLLVK